MAQNFEYDVFLSYSPKDKRVVRNLAKRLESDGLRVWLDEWAIEPEDSTRPAAEKALASSRTLVLAWSKAYADSDWGTFEHHTFVFRDPTNQQRRFIPLLLDDAPVKDSLKQLAWIDWRERSEEQYATLLAACLPSKPSDRLKPEPAHCRAISLGHTDWVWSVAVTPDGRRVLSGSLDNTVRVWDLSSGQCVGTLEGHTGEVLSVAVTPDGRRVLSGSLDNTVRVWDLSSGQCVGTLEGHTGYVRSVAVTPDGRRVLSGSSDKTVRVWDLSSGQCVGTLEGHTGSVRSVAVTPDGRRVLSGSSDKTVRVWDLSSGQCVGTLEGHTGEVRSVAVTPDGRRVLSGSLDNTVRVWDLSSGQCVGTLEGHTGEVRSVAVTPDGRRVLSGSSDKTVRVWDLSSGQCVGTLEGHTGEVRSVAVTPDGRRVLSGSLDNTVRVWDLSSGQCVGTLEGHTGSVRSVAVTPDGRRVLSGSSDKTVRVWDLSSGQCVGTLEGHTDYVRSVAVTPDGRRVLSGSLDKTVRVWDLSSGQCVGTLEGHTGYVWSVAVTPDGRRVLSGSLDNTVRVWDLSSGQCVGTLEGHTGYVRSVAVTPDGRRVLSGSSDKTVRVWDLSSGQCVGTLEGHTGEVRSVAVTPDGRRVLSGSSDKTVRVWDLSSGQCVGTLEGHTGSVWSVAVTPDGRRVLSGSSDNTVRVWDLSSGQCVGTLEGHTGEVLSVAVTPDGLAVSGAFNGVARVWLDVPSLQEDAAPPVPAARYTNAKVLLVGDSGVGKSGLAIRLTQKKFEATVSTDAHWSTHMKLPHEPSADEIDREIWLWDFAGQADYRLIQQLFMDETALAVLVFNPQSENPFEGLGQWDRDLSRAARREFAKLLVAGRCDRGSLMVSRDNVRQFARERGFPDLLETSALTGDGCDRLREAIVGSIDWDSIPYTASPRIFKLLKEQILRMRDEGIVLLRMGELKQQLEVRVPEESFNLDQLRAVVGLLAGPGIVWQLEFGDVVLLQPEWINIYGAAVIRSVRAHIGEIGVILEEDVLAGRLNYTMDGSRRAPDEASQDLSAESATQKSQRVRRLPPDEEAIVLRAMRQTFVDHGLCLREHTEAGTQLVFPSYFRRELPGDPGTPPVLVNYSFNGNAEEIYATLVVQLHHTKAVENDQLWRYAADFKSHDGKRLGLKMTRGHEGAAEISVYFDPHVADDTKVTFIKYVHEHLLRKAQDVKRLRQFVCPHCGHPVSDSELAREILQEDGRNAEIRCQKRQCDRMIPLWDLVERRFASEEFQRRVRDLEELAKAAIDSESKELILIGHAFAIGGEAGQIFRPTPNSDWGIDGEIEFKDYKGNASARRVYLQLKSGDSYLYERKDGKEIFRIKNDRWAEYWQQHAYPVMLVIRTSDGTIRWMDVSAYLKEKSKGRKTPVKQIEFDGEPFTALNLQRMRDRLIRQ